MLPRGASARIEASGVPPEPPGTLRGIAGGLVGEQNALVALNGRKWGSSQDPRWSVELAFVGGGIRVLR